jgi:diaminobutyrate-2-oxoglutarate transaminase
MHIDVFEQNESTVRYYCRKLPNLFVSARGALMSDAEGAEFIDFMSACGTLNYGHNHPRLKSAAIDYLSQDGLIAGLDFHTMAKLRFVETFMKVVLVPRGLDYKLQFPGPTGANCVEAALKLARKATGRSTVVAFTNAFHGMSAGALSVTGSSFLRSGQPSVGPVHRLPFDGYQGAGIEDLERFETMATDPLGGIDPIAAIIVETVQGEGGLNVASDRWLRALSAIARRLGALLIIDDIQAGCGRTGAFFSFERARIRPDMVCLAKSIGGIGLPMSLLLLSPERDVWRPGEHNGTFRGNALAFVTGAEALALWEDGSMAVASVNAEILSEWCVSMAERWSGAIKQKGIAMMRGLEFEEPTMAEACASLARGRHVLIECCGPRDEVLKIMPPLNIDSHLLREGLARVADAVDEALGASPAAASERYETPLDPYDDRGDTVAGAEPAHSVA